MLFRKNSLFFFLVHGILLENSRFYFTAIVLIELNFMVYRWNFFVIFFSFLFYFLFFFLAGCKTFYSASFSLLFRKRYKIANIGYFQLFFNIFQTLFPCEILLTHNCIIRMSRASNFRLYQDLSGIRVPRRFFKYFHSCQIELIQNTLTMISVKWTASMSKSSFLVSWFSSEYFQCLFLLLFVIINYTHDTQIQHQNEHRYFTECVKNSYKKR